MMITALLASLLAIAPADTPAPKDVTLSGQAVLLNDVLENRKIAVDAEPVKGQVVLREEDGTITPILSDPASRALFADESLRNRPIKIQGLRYPDLPYVQVTSFQVKQDGEYRTPEYYCDVCTISVRYPQPCPCCQGSMVLRMKPRDR